MCNVCVGNSNIKTIWRLCGTGDTSKSGDDLVEGGRAVPMGPNRHPSHCWQQSSLGARNCATVVLGVLEPCNCHLWELGIVHMTTPACINSPLQTTPPGWFVNPFGHPLTLTDILHTRRPSGVTELLFIEKQIKIYWSLENPPPRVEGI